MRHPSPVAEIVSTGRYLPDQIVTNDDLARRMDTSDEWIRTRTGISERRIAPAGVSAAFMAAEAGRRSLAAAEMDPGEVDALVVATATPDRWLPSTACDAQSLLGCTNAMAFDVMAACSGWLYGLTVAEGILAARRGEVALVIATEKMSSIVDWNDRATCVLFGDGAGAAVLKPADGSGRGILSSHHRSDGNLAELLYRPAGGARIPLSEAVVREGGHLLRMEGREVFKNAVRSMAEATHIALYDAGLTGEDVDLLIPHQANIRIIEATAKYVGIPMDKVFVNLDRYGNMSSASIPVALDEALQQGRVRKGSIVLTATFGAGLTWGAMTWRF